MRSCWSNRSDLFTPPLLRFSVNLCFRLRYTSRLILKRKEPSILIPLSSPSAPPSISVTIHPTTMWPPHESISKLSGTGYCALMKSPVDLVRSPSQINPCRVHGVQSTSVHRHFSIFCVNVSQSSLYSKNDLFELGHVSTIPQYIKPTKECAIYR